jgi:hypothetical protein
VAPTPAPVAQPPNIVIVIIIINFNIFNPIISFDLMDASGNMVTSVPAGSMPSTPNSVLHQVNLIQDQLYTFTIYSSSQEVMAAGDGSYSVSIGGSVIVSGGADFGEQESTMFTASAPTPLPLPPTDGPIIVIVIIILNFNDFIPLVGFEITDSNSNVVSSSPVGAFSSSSGSVVQQVELEYGKEYTFSIFSSSQEVMSAQDGFYSVTLDGATLVSGGAGFGREESTTFTVKAPTEGPEEASILSPTETSPDVPELTIAGPEAETICSIQVCFLNDFASCFVTADFSQRLIFLCLGTSGVQEWSRRKMHQHDCTRKLPFGRYYGTHHLQIFC